MKTIKWLFRLIVLGLLATLVYQNIDYFLANESLNLDLKISNWQWIFPELQNWVYFVACFLLGIIWTGFNWMISSYKLKKDIKIKAASIDSLKDEVNTLKTELEVFKHDPYIKPQLENKSISVLPTQEEISTEDDITALTEPVVETEPVNEAKEEKPAEA